MSVASWMLRGRNIPLGGRRHQTNEEDLIKLDLSKDIKINAKEILLELTKNDLPDAKRLNYLNNFVKLILSITDRKEESLGYNVKDILYCLRYSLTFESTQVKSGAFRAIRHNISKEEDVVVLNKLLIPYLVMRSLDLGFKNETERVEAMKLIRKILLVSPNNFDTALAHCLVSLANGGIEEKDRILRVCLASLSELGVLNSKLFIESGGVTAITRNLLECQTPKIAESLCGVLLLLLDKPSTRNYAAIDLHCVAAPYCDFHYRHGWMDKNRDERELRFNCSRLALLSILRSWPGILHFCSPSDSSGLRAIVDILYLNQLEVRKAVLDLLYELLNLPQPEWTDELSVALSAIDPAEPQASWRLNEGFVVAEGRSVLPHLARTTPSISDMHLALLLYCFLENGLLGALAEVIATSDTFISVRATVLLGELLRLIQILLPSQCSDITPALPNLLEYATKKPQALRAVTALQQLHKLLKKRPASYSLYLDFILQSGNFVRTSHRSERRRRQKLIQNKSRLSQFMLKNNNEDIKETKVLSTNDGLNWHWSLISLILKGKSDTVLDINESVHRNFLKRLVEFYMPSNNRFSHLDLTSPKNTQGYTIVGVELLNCLLETEDTKLLQELFGDISAQILAITSGRSAHDCLFSPQHMANTQCQSYFLFIGRLSSSSRGIEILNYLRIFNQLEHLATTTKNECYVKLIVSSLDYREAGSSRDVLRSVITCSNENSRLYGTQFLLILLRARIPNFSQWGIKMLTQQLNDKSRAVYLSALNTLHEACEIPENVEQLVKLNPDLLTLGEKGIFLLIRFLSIPSGFNFLNKKDFIVNELNRWDVYYNFRYVFLVEGEISDALTLHKKGEDGRYDKRTSILRSSGRKDLFFPPHIYGQMSKHSAGLQIVVQNGSVELLAQHLENGYCECEEDILKLKAALWALGHLGSSIKGCEYLINKNVFRYMVHLAESCAVYSIKATAFYSIGLLATTKIGADALFKLGWSATRHDRHDVWPILEDETWEEENEIAIESGVSRVNHSLISESSIADADSSTTDEDIFFLSEYGSSLQSHEKSLSLPYNNPTSKHIRSLSESKTFDILITERAEWYRNSSVAESSSSSISYSESSEKYSSDKQQLTPIPSTSSVQTLKPNETKVRRHSESSRRVSLQSGSGFGYSDGSSISPAGSSCGKLSHKDVVGYKTLRMIRNQLSIPEHDLDQPLQKFLRVQSIDRQRKFTSRYIDAETGYFGNYLMEGLSLTSLSSVKRFAIKDTYDLDDQCYMGIALPTQLLHLFPPTPVKYQNFCGNNTSECKVDLLTNPEGNKNSSFKHNTKFCLSCSIKTRGLRKLVNNKAGGDTVLEEKDINVDRLAETILSQVELLANPVAFKHARQTLLDLKQRHPKPFKDSCLYSEVCKVISENSYRLIARRFLHEIFFEVNLQSFAQDLDLILANNESLIENQVQSKEKSDSKSNYSDTAMKQRKLELNLASKINNKNVVIGFNVESTKEEGEKFSPTKYEPRSPPLTSVKEENTSSIENLLNEKVNHEKTENKLLLTKTITLDELKLTCNENKFPIKRNSTVN